MERRKFLLTSAALLAAELIGMPAAMASSGKGASATRWKVRTSEGFDAIAFLGPLSGESLYLEYYAEDADAFGGLLPVAIRGEIRALWQAASAGGFGLLGPNLQVLFS